MQHLGRYFPELKIMRQQLAAQFDSCNSRITELERLRKKLRKPDALALVGEKIRSLEKEKERLSTQIDRIDSETETGMALMAFERVDGGGMRALRLQEILEESARCLSLLSNAHTPSPPPKAILVDPQPVLSELPRAIAIQPNSSRGIQVRTIDRTPN